MLNCIPFHCALFVSLMIGLVHPFLKSSEDRCFFPSAVVRGGYLDTRKHSCGMIEIEYKTAQRLWTHLRPQVLAVFSTLGSVYIGVGAGYEFYLTKWLILTPSFGPGFYWKGKGRDLGCPLEFRSALEISYELPQQVRIGAAISHVSNAHLSHRNPGFNTFTFQVSFPLYEVKVKADELLKGSDWE